MLVLGIGAALLVWIITGETLALQAVQASFFEMADKGFKTSIELTGLLAFWLGMMAIAEKAGMIKSLTHLTAPFFARLFPSLKRDSEAYGPIMLNFSANILGLDNAATPLGIKAMQAMQKENVQEPNRASDAMIMFLVINTAGLTLIPISVMAFRQQAGAANPADILLPAIIGTLISAVSGIIITSIKQKINLLHPAVFLTLVGLLGFAFGLSYWFATMPVADSEKMGSLISWVLISLIVLAFLLAGIKAKINVYETFVEGAKEGFATAIQIIPYLVAMLVAIGVFKSSGLLDMVINGIAWLFDQINIDTSFTPALTVGLMKPFSGSGARALMIGNMMQYGADSFVGKMSCVIQGGTETTFYTLAVYFGAVNVKNARYTAAIGLVVDAIGLIAGICLAYVFFSQL